MEFTTEAETQIALLNEKLKADQDALARKIKRKENKINSTKSQSKKASLTKKLNSLKKNYEGLTTEIGIMNNEISVLRESTQVYDVRFDNANNETNTMSYNYSFGESKYEALTGIAYIVLPKSGDYLNKLAHEMKHMYLFETGMQSLPESKKGAAGYGLYDATDEQQAYLREDILTGKSSTPWTISQIKSDPKYAGLPEHGREFSEDARRNPNSAESIKQAKRVSELNPGAASRLGGTTYYTPIKN